MKGFGIYVKNNLLEPKHIKSMGSAVWLYLWLLDKMTSVTEEGVGKVLGGVPIKFEHIQKELGVPQQTYSDWITRLKEHGYIKVLRIPHGYIISVNKAVKIFNNKSHTENPVSLNSHTENPVSATEISVSNKTVQLDNTNKKKIDKRKRFSTLEEITPEVVEEVANDYRVPLPFAKMQFEKMKNWLEAKGKVYKNYKAGLRNWVLSEAHKAGYSTTKVVQEKKPPEFTMSPEERAKGREKIEEIKKSAHWGDALVK